MWKMYLNKNGWQSSKLFASIFINMDFRNVTTKCINYLNVCHSKDTVKYNK